MALTIVALTISKVIQDIRDCTRNKLETSLAKIQELLGITAASEVEIASLELKIEQLTRDNVLLVHELTNYEDLYFIKEGHALTNILILSNIVRYLKYDDIRSFRVVCRRWKEVSETLFWKLSRIKVINSVGFQNLKYSDWNVTAILTVEEENENKLKERFENTFPSAGIPTKAIVFEGFIDRAVLDHFLVERGWMTLTNICFRDFREPSKTCIDLYFYVTTTVTTLVIKTTQSDHSKFKISLNTLTNIKNLHLENCEILLNGKITPKELTICFNCSVWYKGKLFKLKGDYVSSRQKILINDFVDFSEIKKLDLCGNILRLDVGVGNAKLHHFSAIGVEIIGLNKSQWTTNYYFLRSSTCFGNRLQIKSIDNINTDYLTLPMHIERLAVFHRMKIFIPHIFLYPNLKHCWLKSYDLLRKCPYLDFSNCICLRSFGLLIEKGIYEMDFRQIKLPGNIKLLELRNVDVVTDAPWKVDILHLKEYSFSFARSVSRHFNPVKLKIEFNTAVVLEEDKMSILNFWKSSSIQQFSFGPVKWSDTNQFLNSKFSEYVDMMGNHFLFTKKMNGKGKVVHCDTFSRLNRLNRHGEDYWPLE